MYMHLMYTLKVTYEWDPLKNDWLKKERGISFEQIVFHLSQGDAWKIAPNSNDKKYPDQKIYFVVVNDYIYMVPHENRGTEIYLKTIIPSRKATRDYKKEGGLQ